MSTGTAPSPGADPAAALADGSARPMLGSLPVNRRAVTVAVVLAAVVVAGAALTFVLGEVGVSPGRLVPVLLGNGDASEQRVVWDFRMPQVLVAILGGAGLAMSGAIFQSVTRNPLGSPDVIGLTAGSAAGAAAVVQIDWIDASVWMGAVAGAAIATGLVWIGAGSGFRSPQRMVLTGIGVSAAALAFVQYTMTKAGTTQAQSLAVWLNGSLSARTDGQVRTIAIAMLLLVPAALALTRKLEIIEMGDETAAGLGVSTGRVRTVAIVLGVAFTAAATSVCGPVAFVALIAPQVARRMTGSAGPGLVAAGLSGAALMVLANIGSQHLPFPRPLPVGVLTAGIGGIYLVGLLMTELRKVSV